MRAYQKRVIFLKNTDSEIFEEAYFVVRPSEENRSLSKETMTREAMRIIDERFGRKRKRFFKWRDMIFITVGALLGFLICLLAL